MERFALRLGSYVMLISDDCTQQVGTTSPRQSTKTDEKVARGSIALMGSGGRFEVIRRRH